MIFKLIEKGKNDDIEIAKNITTALEKVDVMAKEELQKDNFNLVDSVNYEDSIKYIMESRAREEENKYNEEPPKEEEVVMDAMVLVQLDVIAVMAQDWLSKFKINEADQMVCLLLRI